MTAPNNGGPAFARPESRYHGGGLSEEGNAGISIRTAIAKDIYIAERELAQFSDADDQDLLQSFGTEAEQDFHFGFVAGSEPTLVANIVMRHKLEARGRAHLRCIEADSLIAELTKNGGTL